MIKVISDSFHVDESEESNNTKRESLKYDQIIKKEEKKN